jgi:hypothetical protein
MLLVAHRPVPVTCGSRSVSGTCVTERCSPLSAPFPPRPPPKVAFFVRPVHRYYGAVRLLLNVHVRVMVYGLYGPVLLQPARRAGDLPVLVHVVSQRARVLRLRRTEQPLAFNAAAVLPSSTTERSRHPDPSAFRSSIARPTGTSIYASNVTSPCRPQDSRPGWIRCSPFL